MQNASDMMVMKWDDEVALIAQKWAENCKITHDGSLQRMVLGRFSVGQNIAWGPASLTWKQVVAVWYKEIEDFHYNISAKNAGHYTQVVWAKSAVLGCGYALCGKTHFYVCNYAPSGNMVGKQTTPFTPGKECGQCNNNCTAGLCDCDGKVCENGGTLDLATCKCKCLPSYDEANTCRLNCSTVTDNSNCGDFFKKDQCTKVPSVTFHCPKLCGLCSDNNDSATKNKGKQLNLILPILLIMFTPFY
ncbi:hypothetical protein ScPMuIL_002275 [Solemya velum]